jgi:hypothetical protein
MSVLMVVIDRWTGKVKALEEALAAAHAERDRLLKKAAAPAPDAGAPRGFFDGS